MVSYPEHEYQKLEEESKGFGGDLQTKKRSKPCMSCSMKRREKYLPKLSDETSRFYPEPFGSLM